MKKALITLSIACIGLFSPACGASIGRVAGVYQAPDKETYVSGECQFTSRDNDALIVVPETVKQIDQFSFTGPSTRYSSGNMGWVYFYDAIGTVGISNVFFRGDCPTYTYTYYLAAHILYEPEENTSLRQDQFQKCTIWYVEGRDGWDEWKTRYRGCGVLKPGAALAILTPNDTSSNSIVPYYEGDSITITTPNGAGVIHYTVDGSEPSEGSPIYTMPIRISGLTTVKAVVVVSSYPFTVVNSCTYKPKVRPITVQAKYMTPFFNSDQEITLSTTTEGASIHYTLDGSEPMITSRLYTSPFMIDDTTTVKAKAFRDDWFESETAIATFTREWYTVETPVIESDETIFENVSQTISLSCVTEGAMILYTTDGSNPKTNGSEYKNPFTIYGSCTIRAIAVKYDCKDSGEITATFTRAEGLSEAVNLYGYLMETDSNSPWTVVTDVSHDGVSCARSGAIGHGGMTWLQTSMRKAGTVSFWWKAACEEAEEEDGETYWYDYGSFFVDGVEKAKIAGNDTGWRKVEVDVPTGGKHVLRWEYRKDDTTSYSPDCIWLDQVQWVPSDGSGCTLTTPYPIPYSWLASHGFGSDSDYETAAKSITGKFDASGRAMSVWQDYVIGTNPTDKKDVLRAMISLEDGVPFVSWIPDLNTNGEIRVYRVFGKKQLTDPIWMYPTNSSHRFFKVKVEMP